MAIKLVKLIDDTLKKHFFLYFFLNFISLNTKLNGWNNA